jgi:selenocysteine lyase/cysteine desulfurase
MNDFRDNFPVTGRVKYLNTANHSPPSTHVKKAIQGFLDDWDQLQRHGDQKVEWANQSFAKLIKASLEEIACQPNTSRGLATVAASIGFKRGENVIVNELENWANVYPWTLQSKKGVEVRIIKAQGGAIRLEDIEKQMDDKTKAVSISQVQWLTGARHSLRPLADLCHSHGAYLVVDGIQAAGALDVDIRKEGVDFYACGSYKWLLGPSGAGFLYARKEHLHDLKPQELGYRAIKEHSLTEPVLHESAQKLEFGEPSYLSFVGTKAAIDHILGLGTKRVEKQITTLAQRLYDGLSSLNLSIVSPEEPSQRSGVISFTTDNPEAHYKRLTEKGYVLSLRPAGIRVSTGFFNTAEEIDGLIDETLGLVG